MARAHARRRRGRHKMVPRTPRTVRPQQVGNPATDPLAAIAHWQKLVGDPLFVYFIQHGDDGPVKIGQAVQPVKRMAELQCGNPVPLRLRAVVLASIDLEDDLHGLWASCCIGGEWFAGGYEEKIVDFARRAMAQQLAHKNDLYFASSSLVVQIVSPIGLAA